jgi:DNA-binding response OmpR family regulator
MPGPSRRPILAGEAGEILVAGSLCVNVGERQVLQHDRPVEIGTSLLFDVLAYLLRHCDQVVTREQLLQDVWGCKADPETRTVDVHIHWLRQKLRGV